MRLLILFLLPLCACAAELPPIRIGVPGAFTGGSAPMGLSMRGGIRLAAEDVNREGGVKGRRIELVDGDDGGVPERGVMEAERLIRQEKVLAAVGFVNTGVSLLTQPIYQRARVPMLTAGATAEALTRQFADQSVNYVFRVAASDSLQAPLAVREAVERMRLKKLAIFVDNTSYGQLGEQMLRQALAEHGLKPSYVARVNLQERDMDEHIALARAAGSEAILTYAIGPELAALANTMARGDWRVPLVGSWTLSMSNFIDNTGPNGEGARMVQTFIQTGDTPARQAFLAAWQSSYHTRRIPSPVSAAQGYDAMRLLVQALREAKKLDGPSVAYALENLRAPVDGAVTRYVRPFSRQDHEAIKASVLVIGKVERGRVVYAHPEEAGK